MADLELTGSVGLKPGLDKKLIEDLGLVAGFTDRRNLISGNMVLGKYIDKYGEVSDNAGYQYTEDLIPVTTFKTYYFGDNGSPRTARFVTAYNSSGEAVPQYSTENVRNIKFMSTMVTHMRVSLAASNTAPQVLDHEIISPQNKTIEEQNLPDTIRLNIKKIDKIPTVENLFDQEQQISGQYIGTNGAVSYNANYNRSYPITVLGGKTIYFGNHGVSRNARYVVAYDAENAIVGTAESVLSYLLPNTATSVIVSYASWYDMFQVEYSEFDEYHPYGNTPRGRVVKSIQSLVFVPQKVYVAVGRTIELYNNQIFIDADSDEYVIRWSCDIGSSLKRKFTVTATSGMIGTHTLTFYVYNKDMKLVYNESCDLVVVAATIATPKSILPIGDSLTNGKPWLTEVGTLSSGNISFVGTRWNGFTEEGTTRHEGRSGASTTWYLENSTYTFDANGEGTGNPFWDPTGERFNWAYYKTQTSLNPDGIQIWLGTNGISDTAGVTAGIKQMVDYIRQDDANIPIFIVNTLFRSNQNGIGAQGNVDGYSSSIKTTKRQEDIKVINLMKALETAFDEGYSNVYFVPCASTMDSEYNYGNVETPVNPRSEIVEYLPSDSIHPVQAGYFQNADIMFGTYCSAFAT